MPPQCLPIAGSQLDNFVPRKQRIFEPIAAFVNVPARIANDARAISDIIKRRMRVSVDPQRDRRPHEVGQVADETGRREIVGELIGEAPAMRCVMRDDDRLTGERFGKLAREPSARLSMKRECIGRREQSRVVDFGYR